MQVGVPRKFRFVTQYIPKGFEQRQIAPNDTAAHRPIPNSLWAVSVPAEMLQKRGHRPGPFPDRSTPCHQPPTHGGPTEPERRDAVLLHGGNQPEAERTAPLRILPSSMLRGWPPPASARPERLLWISSSQEVFRQARRSCIMPRIKVSSSSRETPIPSASVRYASSAPARAENPCAVNDCRENSRVQDGSSRANWGSQGG